MRSSRVKQFLKKEPNLSFVAAKIQQNCPSIGNYNSKATRQGIICAVKGKIANKTNSSVHFLGEVRRP